MSGRKSVVKGFNMFGADGDISASVTSAETSVINLDKASIDVTWTGSAPVGTLTVEATNDEKNEVWRTLDMGGTISISGASGAHELIFNELPFTAIRLVYTRTSGTGTILAKIVAKTVGA